MLFEFCSKQGVLIEANLATLSKFRPTKGITTCIEPKEQHLLTISTAFSPIDVEQPHETGSALYK